MSKPLPVVYLARHGETAWSLSGQHTGLTDLPLTERGERNADGSASGSQGLQLRQGLHQPLQRASRTCELAGFGAAPRSIRSGRMELRRLRGADARREIRTERPDWQLFRDGCPGGERRQRSRAARRPCHRPPARRRWATCSSSPAATSCGCSPRAGWASSRRGRKVLHAEHREPEHPGLRARPLAARDPAVERHSSCRRLIGRRLGRSSERGDAGW